MNIAIPVDVPAQAKELYMQNYKEITKGTKNLFLFAADHKMEHLNKDFYGKNIPLEVNNPERIFNIANNVSIGAFATQLGFISKYGSSYKNINYVIKLNSKTDLSVTDPFSLQLWSIDDVVKFKKNSGLKICGVGFTVYLGSKYESEMLAQAAKIVFEAHQHGLVVILWMYPRGKNVKNSVAPDLIAGAAGVALCLGADFAKIRAIDSKDLKIAAEAAGKTGLICSGGEKVEIKDFLKSLYERQKFGDIKGCAVGRNIYQCPLNEAVALVQAIASIVYENKDIIFALKLYEKNKES